MPLAACFSSRSSTTLLLLRSEFFPDALDIYLDFADNVAPTPKQDLRPKTYPNFAVPPAPVSRMPASRLVPSALISANPVVQHYLGVAHSVISAKELI